MKIGIDIDDTISDTYEVTFAYAQKFTIEDLGKSAKIKDLDNVYHHFYTRELYSWSKEEEDSFWLKYYYKIIREVKPYTFAVETIDQLKKDGHEIIIITARWPEPNFSVKDATLDWLKENNIKYDDIVFNASDKGKVALEKKLDLFIDDSFKNCQDVANAGIKTFIMHTRTNKCLEDEKVTRVYSWPDIYNRIERR